MIDEEPFEDVREEEGGFSLPDLKWRELLFVGALKAEGGAFVRDPARPLPAFKDPSLFPAGVRLEAARRGGRVLLRRIV